MRRAALIVTLAMSIATLLLVAPGAAQKPRGVSRIGLLVPTVDGHRKAVCDENLAELDAGLQ